MSYKKALRDHLAQFSLGLKARADIVRSWREKFPVALETIAFACFRDLKRQKVLPHHTLQLFVFISWMADIRGIVFLLILATKKHIS